MTTTTTTTMTTTKSLKELISISAKVVKVIDVETFLIREDVCASNASKQARKYINLELVLQDTYNLAKEEENQSYEEGDVVVAYVHVEGLESRKWLRARIDLIFDCRDSIKYKVFLLDYGLNVCVNSDLIRRLEHHLGPNLVPFQAIFLHLKLMPINDDNIWHQDALKLTKSRIASQHNHITVLIEGKAKNVLFGNIVFEDGSDLISSLIINGFAVTQKKDQKRVKSSIQNKELTQDKTSNVSPNTSQTPVRKKLIDRIREIQLSKSDMSDSNSSGSSSFASEIEFEDRDTADDGNDSHDNQSLNGHQQDFVCWPESKPGSNFMLKPAGCQ